MSLRDVNVEKEYRTLGCNIAHDFYIPLLNNATEYNRAVGFFSSSILARITEGISGLVKNEGHIKLIASPYLSNEDIEAMRKGYEERKIIIKNALFKQLLEPQSKTEAERLNLLATLIANGTLDIKIAYTESGMYHEKLGIIKDSENNIVAFSGSMNESLTAIESSYEVLDVFTSWNDQEERAKEKYARFNSIWNGTENNLTIIDFPELKNEVIKQYRKHEVNYEIIRHYDDELMIRSCVEEDSFFNFPDAVNPRPYQENAIKLFKENNFQCLFAMATGTGKTLTSLFAANKLCKYKKIKSILIIVPLKDLVDQWEKDVKKYFNGRIILIRSGINWKSDIESINILSILNSNKQTEKFVIITTYDSYSLNNEKILHSLNPNSSLIIADEVHKFGAESYSKKLPEKIIYRIGLSATPKRPYDEKGTKAIFDYFCPTGNAYEFSIKDAIKQNMLCHYNYFPIIVELTEDEMEKYELISEKISKISIVQNNSSSVSKEDEQLLEQLLKERHRIIERAENKKELFINTMIAEIQKKKMRTIVFCPDGKNDEGFDYLETYKKELWQKLLCKNIFVTMSEYVQGTKREIVNSFANGNIDILFAKQRLNEGIDIPAAQCAFFVSSSTSEREFIQRRGRVLRKYKDKKIAIIFDFIVVPPTDRKESQNSKLIISNEVKRAMDFANTADNYIEVEHILKEYI